MTSPTLFAPRESISERFPPHDDSLPFRLTPTPVGNYRCPVSTPANYVHCAGKIRRTKPLQDQFFKQVTQPPRVQGRRPRLTSLARNSRPPRSVSRGGIDYYYVDKRENKREEQLTNTHWLKALCSQPVEEILGKYRRRTDFRRTHVTMMRACSTPGERSLLSAWENNLVRYPTGAGQVEGRGKAGAKSAVAGRGRKLTLDEGNSNGPCGLAGGSDRRATRSEPALSRAQRASDSTASCALSPSTPGRRGPPSKVSARSENRSGVGEGRDEGGGREERRREGTNHPEREEDLLAPPATPVNRAQTFLMDEATSDEDGTGQDSERKSPRQSQSVRFVSFTTQMFRQTDEQGRARTYSKVAKGPEHLPYISNNKRVISMVYNTNVYGKGAIPPTTGPDHADEEPGQVNPISDENKTTSHVVDPPQNGHD